MTLRRLIPVIAAICLAPAASFAQWRTEVVPSIEVGETHDDNVFFTEDGREPVEDRVLRASPTLKLTARSARWSLLGSYGMTAERYRTHSELNDSTARQAAVASVAYETVRTILKLDGDLLETNTPNELTAGSAFFTRRAPVRRLTAGPSASFRLSPLTTLRANARGIDERVDGGVRTKAHSESAGILRSLSARDDITFDYDQGSYSFDSGSLQKDSTTRALLAGWTRDVTPAVQLVVRGGPRETEGDLTADALVTLTRRGPMTSASVSYERTASTLLGYAGLVEVETLGVNLGWTPGRFAFYLRPSAYRTSHEGMRAEALRIGTDLSYRFNPFFRLHLTWDGTDQRGAIDQPQYEFARNTVSVYLTTHLRRQAGDGRERRPAEEERR